MFIQFHRNMDTWNQRGQVSTLIIMFIAAALMLTMVTLNIGKVGMTRTTVANAADAGALAAASWLASVQNEIALIAKVQWVFFLVFQAFLLVPFWWHYAWGIAIIWAMYGSAQLALHDVAEELAEIAWDLSHMQALVIAVTNANIDDQRAESDGDSLAAKMKELSECYEDDACAVPEEFEHTWDRNPEDGARGENTIRITAEYSQIERPIYEMSSWGPIAWIWSPCIFACCWTAFGWTSHVGYRELVKWIGVPFFYLKGSTGGTCFPIPVPLFVPDNGKPKEIINGEGEIMVTVEKTEQSADLRLWTMAYGADGDSISAMATSEYTTTDVGLWPDRDANLRLLAVE